MKALVTGGNGFLGRALVTQLLDQGHEVRVLVRRPAPELAQRGVETCLGCLESRIAVDEACRGVECVFHAAAKAGVWGSWLDYHNCNVVGTQNVLDGCRSASVKLLVYTSSPSVTFNGQECCGCDESEPYPENFLNYYSESKAQAEQLVLRANGLDGLATVALRPHLIWGPGDPHILPRLLKAAREGRLRQIGNGENLVDVTYIENAAAAHLAAAQALSLHGPAAGKAFFISNGEPIRLWDWIAEVLEAHGGLKIRGRLSLDAARKLGGALEWAYRTWRLPGEPPMTRFMACQLGMSHYYNIAAAREHLGYQPAVSLREGMARLLAISR